MLSRNTIKLINSLKIKKYRYETRCFIVEGEKSVAELLQSQYTIAGIYCTENWIKENETIERLKKLEVHLVNEIELGKISDLTTPNKVLAVASIPPELPMFPDDYNDLVLALDGIRDPGNMGTILRTADWFGIQHVVCSPGCVDIYNPKVIQATMGSFIRIQIHTSDLTAFIKQLPEKTPVFGALLSGPKLAEKKFPKPGILVIGNESRGISPELIPLITDPIFIPFTRKKENPAFLPESLNASIANAIICYEIRKQLSENKF